MAVLIFGPRIYVADENGEPIVGARLYTYATGTSTPVTTYANAIATVPHANPILSLAGGYFPAIYAKPSLGALKFRFFSYDPLTLTETNLGIDTDPAYSPLTVTDLITTSNDLAQLLESLDITEAETASNVTPTHFAFGTVPYNVRRVGVEAGGDATLNTAALQALFDPTVTGITGPVVFPNASGTDVYEFNDLIPVRDGIRIDLCGSTLKLTKTGVTGDTYSGFFHALRDFAIENGTLIVDYTYTAGSNTGNAIALGGRASSAAQFPSLYDSELASPMGNISIRNMKFNLTNTAAQSRAVFAIGGLQNVTIEDVTIDGNLTALGGIYFEFGWATSETDTEDRQTSHANGVRVKNVIVKNLDVASSGIALGLTGTYDVSVENLKAYTVKQVINVTPGESLFYRPWSNNDGIGVKRNISLRNIVGAGVTGLGLGFTGASTSGAPAYLAPLALTAVDETDLLDVTLDGFAIDGTVANHGIQCSAGRLRVANGDIRGFQRGIVTTQECTQYAIEGVRIFNCTSFGIQIGQGTTIYSPARFSQGEIRGCFLAGNGTASAAGTVAAITVATAKTCVIESNRFGYELIHDTLAETSQGNAVAVATDSGGVICRSNHVADVAGSAVGYLLSGGGSRGCTVENATGIVTTSGDWVSSHRGVSADVGDAAITLIVGQHDTTQLFNTAISTARAVGLSTSGAVKGDAFRIVRTAAATGASAVNVGTGPLKALAVGTWAVVEYNGSAWVLVGYGAL